MNDKILPIIQKISLLYDFSITTFPESPHQVMDCEGHFIIQARNEETARLICDLLNTLYDYYEEKDLIKYQ